MLLSTYESVCYCLLVDVTSNVGYYVYRWTLFCCLLMDRHVNWELLSTTDGLSCYRLVFVFWWIITRLSSGGPCCCPQLDHCFLLLDFYLIVHRHARPLVVTLASTDWFWSCRPQTGLCCCPVLRCHVTVYCGLFYCPQQVFTDHWELSPSEQLFRYCKWRVFNANVEWSLLLLSTVGCYTACDWTTLDCVIVRWWVVMLLSM